MNGALRATLASAGLVFLVGCAGTELQKAETMSPQGTSYDRSLYDGYLGLSEGEYNEGDYSDSDYFAMRAMDAGSGKNVQPEMISSRNLPADKVDELTQARLRLMTALSSGVAEEKPLEAADAQIAFDCWMQEQEENFQPGDIASCRDRFMASVAMLEEQQQCQPGHDKRQPLTIEYIGKDRRCRRGRQCSQRGDLAGKGDQQPYGAED